MSGHFSGYFSGLYHYQTLRIKCIAQSLSAVPLRDLPILTLVLLALNLSIFENTVDEAI